MQEHGERSWRSKNGRVQLWDQMAITHLRNTAGWIERQGEAATLDPRLSDLTPEGVASLASDMRAYADWREGQEAQNAPAS